MYPAKDSAGFRPAIKEVILPVVVLVLFVTVLDMLHLGIWVVLRVVNRVVLTQIRKSQCPSLFTLHSHYILTFEKCEYHAVIVIWSQVVVGQALNGVHAQKVECLIRDVIVLQVAITTHAPTGAP